LDDPAADAPAFEELEHDVSVAYADLDAGPTKAWMIHHRADEPVQEMFELGFGKRPAEELYDVGNDPDHMHNLAADPQFLAIKEELSATLMNVLREEHDPRVCEEDCRYEKSPYTDPFERNEPHDRAAERWERS
jgi:hypothetical protein